jgi:sulfur-oxidizing protein SoxX
MTGIARSLLPVSLSLWASLAVAGDADRGRALMADRTKSLCVLCHSVPGTPAHLHGSLAPDLAGAGSRYSEAALLAHITAPQRFNPESIMPAYARTEGLVNVNHAWEGKPVLQTGQIDDIIAYLLTLKDPP